MKEQEIIALLRESQGDQTQAGFAETLGISQGMLSMIYSGQRRPGRTVLTKLIQAKPQLQPRVAALFFASKNHSLEEPIATVKEQTP